MLPKFAPISQSVTTEHIQDVPGHLRRELSSIGLAEQVWPGMSVAIGVGSRGVGCMREVVLTLIEVLRELGARPFLVPAMGSHGGGTAAGQQQVLVDLGLGAEQTGVPILSDMAVAQIGTTQSGMPVYFETNAARADAIIAVNRIKPHTAFRNQWESGLFKILAVGFGKRQGAAEIHAAGLRDAMPAAARVILESLPVIAAVGIVENGLHQPRIVRALRAASIEQEEPKLLEAAWQNMPRIPIEPLDLLVLGEIGKDISGTGMDINVVGMWRRTGGPVSPAYRAIVALDLTPASHGNGIGVGYADIIPQRLRDKLDYQAIYTNCLTAGNYNGAKIPITLPTDRDAIEAALPVAGRAQSRAVIARNTRDLAKLWVSESLLEEVTRASGFAQLGPVAPMEFAADGRLLVSWD